MLASMSEIPQVTMASGDWSGDDVSELVPTGTVTLLLADVEGSTQLWQTRPDEMGEAIATLDRTLTDLVSAHRGVRPVEQGEGDSFVIAFTRASDAVACALDLQRAPLAPIRLRIGAHTGEVQLRDAGNYIGPAINRTARLRELAHGGQTVLSGTTADLVAELLPDGAWLADLGTHALRDLPRPERVVQLCHPDLHNDFPPLRAADAVVVHRLPAQLTSFVGRTEELAHVQQLLDANRIVTLTGSGGVGKTRLAAQVAVTVFDRYPHGIWYVDLAPITDPMLAAATTARSLGLPDTPGRSAVDAIARFISDQHMLVILDNCEHLLDACATLIDTMLGACPALTVLATSREPVAVTGEQLCRVPPLAVEDQAIELFTDRARHARPDFTATPVDLTAIREICGRLDGMPLAIELAAARVRALSLIEILDGLHDRFRLLTGGSRTAVRRQQTLRASVDWSHALLSEPERVLFRRVSVFCGGFDLDAAQAVAAGAEVHRYEVVDLLTLLVDKSLLTTENTTGRTRYRLLETVRQFAQEKLGESGEADTLRARHRDHYAAIAAALDAPSVAGHERRLAAAEAEIDNLRAAFAWCRDNGDTEQALLLASSLQPLWRGLGRFKEGVAWLDAALDDHDARPCGVDPACYAQALINRAFMDGHVGVSDHLGRAPKALAIARDVGDPVLLARALAACGAVTAYNPDAAWPPLAEAADLARSTDDTWTLAEILGWQTYVMVSGQGDPAAACATGEEAVRLADEVGAQWLSRMCRYFVGQAHVQRGNLDTAIAMLEAVIEESAATHDTFSACVAHLTLGTALACRGDTDTARIAARSAIALAADISPVHTGLAQVILAFINLAAGDVAAAAPASDSATQSFGDSDVAAIIDPNVAAQIAYARGDLESARRLADAAVATARGSYRALALTTRCRLAATQGDLERADQDAYEALNLAASVGAYTWVPESLECVAAVMAEAGRECEAVRLFGAADTAAQRMGVVRFKIYQQDFDTVLVTLRNTLGEPEFETAWSEGAALSTEDAVSYAQRGRGERKRPSSGWASLTPTELDVTRLVGEGLGNKEIGARLFISPRTVQTHLTHVYTKLGLTSRVQLARETLRNADAGTSDARG